jgi:hypothetical protein
MTIIEKIKRSVEAATGLPFLYHAAGEINELIARAESLPVAFAFLLDSGTIDDVNGRYRERVTLAVMFADKSQFDFNAIENEQIIDRMKIKAYKWLQSLRLSNDLNIVTINQTQRLYDATTDILTGFSVNVTIEDVAGVGECELPQVVIDVKKNGSYDVVGVDKVRVNVPNTLTDLIATENGKEYLPSDYGAYGFGSVKTDLKKIAPTSISFGGFNDKNPAIFYAENEDYLYIDLNEHLQLNSMDWSNVTSLETFLTKFYFSILPSRPKRTDVVLDLRFVDASKLTNIQSTFLSFTNYYQGFSSNPVNIYIDIRGWDLSSIKTINDARRFIYTDFNRYGDRVVNMLGTKVSDTFSFDIYVITAVSNLVGDVTLEDVINNDLKVMEGLSVSSNLSNSQLKLTRKSLRAVINGLADLTGQTAQTLTLGATLIAKLTEEDIAIATNKNWTIV